MNIVIYMAGAAGILSVALLRRTKFSVPDGHYGLLYRHGEYQHRISPGAHCFWSRKYSVRLVDMRKLSQPVTGEEVVTADKVGVKVNAVLFYQVIQAETAMHTVKDYLACLNDAMRRAIGQVIGTVPVERILNHRFGIEEQLFVLVLAEADKLGIVIHAVEVTDVMVAGGLNQVMSAAARRE